MPTNDCIANRFEWDYAFNACKLYVKPDEQ